MNANLASIMPQALAVWSEDAQRYFDYVLGFTDRQGAPAGDRGVVRAGQQVEDPAEAPPA